jgi:hypothetical protein
VYVVLRLTGAWRMIQYNVAGARDVKPNGKS